MISPCARGHGARAGVEEQEVARAVGALGLALRRSSTDRRAPPAGRRAGAASGMPSIAPTTPLDGPIAGSSARGTPIASSRPSSQSSVSRSISSVRLGVGRVGDVDAGEVPGEPAVDRARRKLAGLGSARARPGARRAATRAWGPRSRSRAAGPSARGSGRASRAPRRARRCACPATRSRSRAGARLALPQHDGLALVGDADRGHVRRRARPPPRAPRRCTRASARAARRRRARPTPGAA